MAGRRIKMQALSNSNLTECLDDYADLNLVSTLGGTISTSAVTGSLTTLSGTYADDLAALELNLKELQTKVNSILAALV